MAITKRPTPPTEADVDRLIRKGGSVPGEQRSDNSGKPQLLQLRLPRSLVQEIDASLKSRTVPPSRHTWLLEAIHEKLKRGESK